MSANSELSEYLAFRKITKALLCVTGLWSRSNSGLLYSCIPLATIFISFYTSFAILSFVAHHIAQVPVIVRGLSIGTSFASVVLKIICIIRQRKRALQLHRALDKYCSDLVSL
ncbi:uncharacterized protein [Fopius arisanus]|uniref:Uncharacterized protein n=1 Tax=Fopius arisanus TaxID=64838 RepID=A0A9R1U5E7_9HYME|nr:PREDICTED: uncharacterized protein LOC105269300 [Fopius arisanus]